MSLSTHTTTSGLLLLYRVDVPYVNSLSQYRISFAFNTLCAAILHVRSLISATAFHADPPQSSEQPNPTTQTTATAQWVRLILAYARHKKLFILRVEDAETAGSDWEEILRNTRINRMSPLLDLLGHLHVPAGKILPGHLSNILESMVGQNLSVYEPAKQTRSVLVYWRLPEEWAEVLYEWVISTGQLNTILTFYDITDPPLESLLTGIPISLLRKAIAILGKTGRSQTIAIADGEGVRFLARSK